MVISSWRLKICVVEGFWLDTQKVRKLEEIELI